MERAFHLLRINFFIIIILNMLWVNEPFVVFDHMTAHCFTEWDIYFGMHCLIIAHVDTSRRIMSCFNISREGSSKRWDTRQQSFVRAIYRCLIAQKIYECLFIWTYNCLNLNFKNNLLNFINRSARELYFRLMMTFKKKSLVRWNTSDKNRV